MAECAHFHYENVDFGNIQVSFLFLRCPKLHGVLLTTDPLGRDLRGGLWGLFGDKKLEQ